MDVVDLVASGLYDPHAPEAGERLELLQFLAGQGAGLAEMVEADREGRLVSVLLDRALRPRGGGRMTFAEAARQAGLDVVTAARAHQAVGLAAAAREGSDFTESDVEMLRAFADAEQIFGEDVTLQLGRVIGQSVSRMAEAEVSAFLLNIAAPLVADDAGKVSMAWANSEVAAMLPSVSRLVDLLHRRHLETAIRRFHVPHGDGAGYETLELGIGFADLVGFTGLSQQLSVRELAAAIGTFEKRTAVLVADSGGRIVKLIGDEVMFVTDGPGEVCRVMVSLLEAFDGTDGLPPLRGGLSCGQVLLRDGDYFGPVVNLANRSVKLARPETALVSHDVVLDVADLPQGWRFGAAHVRRIKGFERRVPLHSLRRARRAARPLRTAAERSGQEQ